MHIEITYEKWSPGSEHADPEKIEHGFCSPGGWRHAMPLVAGDDMKRWCRENVVPCWEYDPDTAGTSIEQAVKFLRWEGITQPTCNAFCPEMTWTVPEPTPDYQTGIDEYLSAHLRGFTEAQEREIYEAMMRRN